MSVFPPPVQSPPPPGPPPGPASGQASGRLAPRRRWPLTLLVGTAAAVVSFMVFRPSGSAPVVHTPDPAVQTVPHVSAPGGPPVLTPEDLQPIDPAVTALPSG